MKEFIKKYYKNIILLFAGTIIIGIAAAFYVVSGIGSNSITTFCLGISRLLTKILKVEVSSGVGLMVGNGLFAIILLIFARKYLNFGTILAIFLIGPICNLLLYLNILKALDTLFIKIIYSVIATIISGIGVVLIIKAQIGVSPFDGVSLLIHDKLPKINYSIIRIIYDALLFLAGFLMGEVVGIGSVIAVVFTGPLIYLFSKLYDLIMSKKKNKIDDNDNISIEE